MTPIHQSTALFGAALLIAASGAAQAQTSEGAGPSLIQPSQPSTSVYCVLHGHRAFNPGISLIPSRGTFFADTPTTTVCVGTYQGEQLAPGLTEFTLSGTYGTPSLFTPKGDTCLFGAMTGDVTLTFHTVSGRSVLSRGTANFTRTGLLLTARGSTEVPGSSATAEIVATPDPGQDCVVTPLTGVTINAVLKLTEP